MAKQKTSGAVCRKYHLEVVEQLEKRIAELSAKVLEYEQMADDFKRAADKAEKRIAELEAQLHSTRNTLFARATDVQNLQAACECAEKERDRARARAVDLERVRGEARAYAIVEAERERDEARAECRQCRADIRRLVEVRDEALAEVERLKGEAPHIRELRAALEQYRSAHVIRLDIEDTAKGRSYHGPALLIGPGIADEALGDAPREAERERDEARSEVERLRDWERIITNAPGEARDNAIERLRESGAMQPIIDAWREKLAAAERERDEAQEDARAARRERDEAIRTREEQDTEAQHRAEQYCREKRQAKRERAAATDLLLRIYDRPNWYWATAIKELLDRLKGGA